MFMKTFVGAMQFQIVLFYIIYSSCKTITLQNLSSLIILLLIRVKISGEIIWRIIIAIIMWCELSLSLWYTLSSLTLTHKPGFRNTWLPGQKDLYTISQGQTSTPTRSYCFPPAFPHSCKQCLPVCWATCSDFGSHCTSSTLVPSPSLSSTAATAQMHMVANVFPTAFVCSWEAPSCTGINKQLYK